MLLGVDAMYFVPCIFVALYCKCTFYLNLNQTDVDFVFGITDDIQ